MLAFTCGMWELEDDLRKTISFRLHGLGLAYMSGCRDLVKEGMPQRFKQERGAVRSACRLPSLLGMSGYGLHAMASLCQSQGQGTEHEDSVCCEDT